MRGIDISHYQEGMDLAKAGVDFVILKISESSTIADPAFDRFYAQARAIGLPVGAYVFSHALTPAAAVAEAKYAISLLNGRELTLGLYMDVETYQQMALAKSQLVDTTRAFRETVEAAGYISGLYGSEYNLWTRVDPNDCGDSIVWVAHYGMEPDIPCDIWQSSNHGRVPGYNGDVDEDQARSSRFIEMVGGKQEEPKTAEKDPIVLMLQSCMFYDGYISQEEVTGIKTPEFRKKIVEYAADVAAC